MRKVASLICWKKVLPPPSPPSMLTRHLRKVGPNNITVSAVSEAGMADLIPRSVFLLSSVTVSGLRSGLRLPKQKKRAEFEKEDRVSSSRGSVRTR